MAERGVSDWSGLGSLSCSITNLQVLGHHLTYWFPSLEVFIYPSIIRNKYENACQNSFTNIKILVLELALDKIALNNNYTLEHN